MTTIVTSMNVGGTRYKGKQINVPQPETLAKNTLDATHKSRLKHFKDERKALNPKKNELVDLEKQLQKLKNVDSINRDYLKITQTEDRIAELKKEIEYIESGKAELEYYSKAGELLIEFYDNVSASKNKKGKGKKKVAASGKSVYDLFMQPSISESVQTYIAEQRMLEQGTNSNYEPSNYEPGPLEEEGAEIDDLNDSCPDPVKEAATKETAEAAEEIEEIEAAEEVAEAEEVVKEVVEMKGAAKGAVIETVKEVAVIEAVKEVGKVAKEEITETKSNKGLYHKLTNFVEKQEGFKRADYFGEYLNIIDPHYVPEEDMNTKESLSDSFCEDCGCYRNLNPTDATMVCPQCSTYVVIVIDSDKPNYKDPPAEISNFPYRRINHFNECLSQFQAKESTEIPQIVYDIILMEMKKERLTNMAQLTREKVHTYLKKQANKKFTNYYEHIPHIIHRLTGIQPKTMTPKMEEELRRDFHKIQEPYAKHKPKNRKNFLNYNYVLHKLCQIRSLHDREYKEFLSCFPLLKSRDKLLQQDIVWRKICVDLGWRFIKSV